MRFDSSNAELLLFTYKEGPLSPFGHDLEIKVTSFTIDVADDKSRVEATFDAGSLRVVGASVDGRVQPLSERDRSSIEETTANEVLEARRFPKIQFRSTAIIGDELRGTLELVGRSREIVCHLSIVEGNRYSVSARIHQPDWGIKPYRAMLGALRVRADVDVKLMLTLVSP